MISLRDCRWLITLIVCGFTISACGNDDSSKGDASVLSSADSILRFIPAGTPYMLANTAPLPDELYDSFEPKMDAVLDAYQRVIREVVRTQMGAVPEDERDDETQRLVAIADELSSLFSVTGIREAGIGRESTFAFYGNGLLPVLRIQLSDSAAFEAAIARIEEQAGHQLQTAELDGKPYRYIGGDDARVVIAIFDDQAVFTVAPDGFDNEQLSQLVGLTLPARSIAASGELQDIAKEYGFTNHYIGLISPERMANTFLDGPVGLDADVFALMGEVAPEISDVCRSEIRSLVSVMPRMVVGYTRIDAKRIDSTAVIELRDDIALGISGLSAPVPGLGIDQGGLVSFGFSLNLKAARAFYAARLDAMEADPYQCDQLQEFQVDVVAGREALNRPVPPMVYDFKGFLAVIDDFAGMDLANNIPPTSLSATILLAMDNVEALIAMGSMFSPEVAGLNLQPDGKPVSLDLPQAAGSFENPFIAMTDSALVISVGDGAEAKAVDLLDGAFDERPLFMSVAIDAQRYYELVGDAIAAGNNGDDVPSPALQIAMQDAMDALGNIYERMAADVRFTSRGVEIDGRITMVD